MRFTRYEAVDALLEQLLDSARAILRDNLAGMYLYGSLALGDFDPAVSDVDVLVALREDVTPEEFARLSGMHQGIFESGVPLAAELEGSYIPLRALRRYNPGDIIHPHIDRGGGLAWEPHHTDWVIRYLMVRERGIVLAGPPPTALMDPIAPRELKQAILDMLWWWEQQLEDHRLVAEDGYQWYTVQTMCRILYTMETGEITSKPAASRWAMEHLDARWRGLIRRAMEWRPPAKMDRLEETLDFIGETLRIVKESSPPA